MSLKQRKTIQETEQLKRQKTKKTRPLFEGRIIFVRLLDSTQLNDGHEATQSVPIFMLSPPPIFFFFFF